MPKIIDFHIHPPGPGGLSTQEQAEMAAYFRGDPPPSTTEEMADYYQRLGMFGVLFAIDTETVTGRPPVPNQYFADCIRRWPDTFTAFGNVDPHKGKAAVLETERIADLGLKGLKFHPSTQQFYPNDPAWYPSGRRPRNSASSSSSTPVRQAWAPAAPAAAA